MNRRNVHFPSKQSSMRSCKLSIKQTRRRTWTCWCGGSVGHFPITFGHRLWGLHSEQQQNTHYISSNWLCMCLSICHGGTSQLLACAPKKLCPTFLSGTHIVCSTRVTRVLIISLLFLLLLHHHHPSFAKHNNGRSLFNFVLNTVHHRRDEEDDKRIGRHHR